MISRQFNYLFLLSPRTGSTATASALGQHLYGEWIPGQDVLDDNGMIIVQRKHSTVDELLEHKYLNQKEAQFLFKFTTVRNPFDSAVSSWVKKRTTYQPLLADRNSWIYKIPDFTDDMEFVMNHTFPDWVEKNFSELLASKKPRHMYGKFVRHADFVMRFETLQEDFNIALGMMGVEREIEIPTLGVTQERKKDYREYYDENSRRIVEAVYKLDMDKYGYDFHHNVFSGLNVSPSSSKVISTELVNRKGSENEIIRLREEISRLRNKQKDIGKAYYQLRSRHQLLQKSKAVRFSRRLNKHKYIKGLVLLVYEILGWAVKGTNLFRPQR